MSEASVSQAVVAISVRQLAAFSGREGDLEWHSNSGLRATASDGIKGQQRLRKRRPAGYQHEVSVSYRHRQSNGIELQISGRIDGLFADDNGKFTIEEIKTSYNHPSQLPTAVISEYKAQLHIYGHLFCHEHALPRLSLRLCFLDPGDDSETFINFEYPAEQLSANFHRLLSEYLHWRDAITVHRQGRNQSAKQLKFPFPEMRSQQRQLAAACYSALCGGPVALIQAPTGSGKTIAALFAAAKAMGESRLDHCYFASAKTPGQLSARMAIALLTDAGLTLKSLELTAKEKICPCLQNEPLQIRAQCQYCQNFYDKLPAARCDLLAQPAHCTSATLLAVAERHVICPHALASHTAPWFDLVVGDFNYLFDPFASRDFNTSRDDRHGLLLDEVHNLVPRCRDMYSASIDRPNLIRVQRILPDDEIAATKALQKLLRGFNKTLQRGPWKKLTTDSFQATTCPPSLLKLLTSTTAAMQQVLESVAKELFPHPWLDEYQRLHWALTEFLFKAEQADSAYCLLASVDTRERPVQIELLCCDPATHIQRKLGIAAGSVLLSATITPIEHHARALGVRDGYGALDIPSPFAAQHLGVFIASWIDTRLYQRDLSQDEVCELIELTTRMRPGRYLVFFPSYQYLASCAKRFAAIYQDHTVLCQTPAMAPDARRQWLECFTRQPQCIGFVILGGIFGEGIDLPGEALIGSIIVGVGLANPTPRQAALENYFRSHGENGYDYTYRYPALTRVAQAGGRVIRHETDIGIIILADQRFTQPGFLNPLPAHWQPIKVASPAILQHQLLSFWQQHTENMASANCKE